MTDSIASCSFVAIIIPQSKYLHKQTIDLFWTFIYLFLLTRALGQAIMETEEKTVIAKREVWKYSEAGKVWVGKYRNSHNLIHWHPDCELLYVEKGSIDVFCERRKHSLGVGDGLFVASGQMHYMRARTPDTVLIVIVFDPGIVSPYFGGIALASPRLEHSYPIPELYLRLRACLIGQERFFGAEAAKEVLALMLDIYRNERLSVRSETKSVQSLRQLLEQINEKYEYFTFEDAVSFMAMSPSYFSRYFHETTGSSFSQYLNYVRTDNAIRLLRAGELSMTDVALQCGFGTIRSFNRVFKELTGYSPRQLPEDFVLDEKFAYPSEVSFNPTLFDCELIESGV